MTDMQIREFAEKHGWIGVEAWWSMAIPRFRAMLEEYAARCGDTGYDEKLPHGCQDDE